MSRRRLLECLLAKTLLPKEYQEVEYIESTGTQYINTGFTLPWNVNLTINDYDFDSVICECACSQNNTSIRCFGHSGLSSTGNLSFGFDKTNNYVRIASTNAYDYVDTTVTSVYDFHKIELSNGSQKVDDVEVSTNQYPTYFYKGTYRPTEQILLFVGVEGWNNNIPTGSAIKLKYAQFKKNNVLVRNFIPCYRKSDRAIGLYDTVNGVFYTNAGTGEFIRGPIKAIPNIYQEVEYIESDGTQYIDTGFAPQNTKYIYETEFAFTEILTDGTYSRLFGNLVDSSTALVRYQYRILGGTINHYPCNNTSTGGIIGVDLQTDTFYNLKITQTKWYIDNYEYNLGTDAGTTNNTNIALFSSKVGGESTKTKIKYFKISDINNNLIRDFVPVYRKSDNEIGLYDLVNKVFYTNSGTGTFTKGNDIV